MQTGYVTNSSVIQIKPVTTFFCILLSIKVDEHIASKDSFKIA